MRAFVTGGNGFIGSVVVRYLAEAGHDVVCLLRPESRRESLAGLRYDQVIGDVRDLASVRRAMRSCQCTVHLAAPGGWEADDAAELHAGIVEGTRNVLAAAAEHAGHRVVYVSSTAAIGASDTPLTFDERAEFNITDRSLHYAHAKHRAELAVREAVVAGVPAVIVNPAEVYGPGDVALGTARNLLDLATSWPVLVCHGGTGIVHVEDVAAGIIAALEHGRAGERYILSGENLTIRELAELVLTLRRSRSPVVEVPNGLARLVARVALTLRVPLPFEPNVVPYATRYWFVDNRKARRELGVAFRGARDTILETLAWLEQARLLAPVGAPSPDGRAADAIHSGRMRSRS